MKKFLLVLLCAVFCFACGCNQDPVNEEVPAWDSETGGSPDFNGKTFYVSADIDPTSTTFLSYIRDTLFGEAALQRFADVEKQYNCEIRKSTTVKTVEDILLHSSAGVTDIDFYVEHIFYGGNEFKTNGFLLPMSAVSDVIDLNNTYKWGTPNMLEEFTYQDEVYGVLPMAWPDNNFMSLDFLLVFNSNITQRLSLQDPREYLENGTWTFDQFEKVLHDYTFTDDFGNHIKAFNFDTRHLLDLSLRAHEAYLCEKDSSGQWVTGYFGQNAVAALEWVKKIATSAEFADCIEVGGAKEKAEKWANGLLSIALLTSNYTFSTSSSGDSSCDVIFSGIPFALLTFPTADGSTIISQHERTINAIMIPSWTSVPEETAMVIDAIFEPIAGLNTEEDMIDYYTNNLVFDRRDAELLFKMQKVSRYLFHDEGINSLNRDMYDALMTSSPKEVIDKFTDRISTLVEEEIIPVKEGMYELFGYEN